MNDVERAATEVWWMDLPEGSEGPVTVFVNGRELTEGHGLHLDGRRIHFDEPLRARPAVGFWRQVMLFIGIGVYGDLKGDTVDVQFMRAGRREMISDRRAKATGPKPA